MIKTEKTLSLSELWNNGTEKDWETALSKYYINKILMFQVTTHSTAHEVNF